MVSSLSEGKGEGAEDGFSLGCGQSKSLGTGCNDFLYFPSKAIVHSTFYKPNQIGFEGALPPRAVAIPPPSKRHIQGIKKTVPIHEVKLKVNSLLLYPDFEYNFDMFQALRSMQAAQELQVCINVADATSPEMARMLLQGMAIPVMDSNPDEDAAADAAAAAAAWHMVETQVPIGRRKGVRDHEVAAVVSPDEDAAADAAAAAHELRTQSNKEKKGK
eukprot:gene13226-19067_t